MTTAALDPEAENALLPLDDTSFDLVGWDVAETREHGRELPEEVTRLDFGTIRREYMNEASEVLRVLTFSLGLLNHGVEVMHPINSAEDFTLHVRVPGLCYDRRVRLFVFPKEYSNCNCYKRPGAPMRA